MKRRRTRKILTSADGGLALLINFMGELVSRQAPITSESVHHPTIRGDRECPDSNCEIESLAWQFNASTYPQKNIAPMTIVFEGIREMTGP